jgi:hypothetical protein
MSRHAKCCHVCFTTAEPLAVLEPNGTVEEDANCCQIFANSVHGRTRTGDCSGTMGRIGGWSLRRARGGTKCWSNSRHCSRLLSWLHGGRFRGYWSRRRPGESTTATNYDMRAPYVLVSSKDMIIIKCYVASHDQPIALKTAIM